MEFPKHSNLHSFCWFGFVDCGLLGAGKVHARGNKVSRRQLIDKVVGELRGEVSRGVVLVGSHGTGKTWLVGQILNRLGSETGIIRLSPSRALSRVPFGAVNARIGAVPEHFDQFHGVATALVDQIRELGGNNTPVVLVVDNGSYLDPQSAAVIGQALAESSAKMMLVDHPGASANALLQLWRDGSLSRHELSPLSHAEVRVLMEGVLGGTVAGAAALYLSQRTAGNPLLVKGLVAGALEDKTLHEVDNVWVLDHPVDQLGAESRDFLKMDLAALSPDSRRLVDILAMAGPLPLETVLALCSTDDLDDVQQHEFATITVGPSLTVELTRPALSHSIRELIPLGRNRRLRQEVLACFDPYRDANPQHIIAAVLWTLDCDLDVTEEQALEAARLANQQMRPDDAWRIASRVVGGELHAAALVQQSLACYYANKLGHAQELAEQARALALDPESGAAALGAYFRAYGPMLDFAELFPTAVAAYTETFGPLDSLPAPARLAAELVVVNAAVSLGDCAGAEEKIAALLQRLGEGGGPTRTMLTGLLCEVRCVVGRGAEAFALALQVFDDLEPHGPFPRPDISVLAYARATAAVIYFGEWDLAEKLLAQENFTNTYLILPSGGLRHLGGAMMNVRRGRIEEALADLVPGVAALVDYDPWLMLPISLGLMAYCLAMRGDRAGARQRLAQLATVDRRGNAFYTLESEAYAAAAEAIIADHDGGVQRLRELREECAVRGYLALEFTICSLALRTGDSTVLGRFHELAYTVDSKHTAMNKLWADALVSNKGEDLEQASISAANNGYELLAAELAALAQRRYELRGKQHMSRKASAMALSLRDQMPGTVSPIFRTVDQPDLTRREHEIAKFVALGDSNNAIAERLHVSLRTVEGHLYRMFIKLDIKSRDELAQIINTSYPAGERKD